LKCIGPLDLKALRMTNKSLEQIPRRVACFSE
jgi:hypothetical protein